ncbi:alpha/beta hydrolase [Mycolicibacterium peregrinum]|uniref:Uncharacterized protein n=1 Tax=Mycolicibacterium peregrinum TaxID=43304 RepID=A0A1A0WFJ8_MYCPR|nr:alpha/beta hydrolase [Mycolicibacterium peregrinum]OBB97167.1 hypothetical protein A5779_15540 [Mycolicibacterium peregrinum]
MTIQIPGYLQWVSYLTGSEWPQGDEDAMRRIGDYWRDAADDLSDLIPDLNRVRSETLSVLMGETADAAEEQFAMLFDGDYSVDKLSQAMSALGDLADGAGTEIEYTKLQILTSLAIAAAEIAWALAAAPETFGGSLGLIPVTEAATMMAVRQIVAMLLRQLVKKLGEAMTKTLVRRLLREAAQEIAIGLGQELAIQGFQAAQGNRDGIDWKQAGIVAAASGIGGAVGSPVGEGLTRAMGRSDNPVTNALKGALSGYGAGIAGNVAGTLGTGGELDAVSIFGGAASSAATGGVHGAKSGSHSNSPNGNGRPDTGSPGSPDTNGANDSHPGGEAGNNGQQSHNGSHSQSPSNTSTSTPATSPSDNGSHAGVSSSQDTSAATPATSTSQDPVSHTAPTSQTPTNGESGPSAPSENSHAPAGRDGSPAQHDGGPTNETSGTQEPANQNSTPTNDAGQQPNHTGDPKHTGDPTESTNTRPDTITAGHPTDTSTDANTDTATHTAPAEHTTTEPQQSAPVAQPAASTPAAPSTPSMSTPTSPSTTPAPTTPANNPSTPPATPAKASPTDTPAPTARPSLSEPSTTHTSTEPAGTPTARSAEIHAAQDRSGQEATDSQDGQHHQDPDAKPESAIPPIAVTPVLPNVGGDGVSTRAGDSGRPNATRPGQRPVDGADRIGARRDPADGQPPRNGEPPDRDGGRARPSEDADHSDQTPTNGEIRDPAQIVDELGQHRTDQDNGQTADVHDAAQRVRDQWSDLTQAERDAVIAQETRDGHRTDLGDLDGLPASVRDVLNRHNLVEDMVAVHPQHADAIRGYADAMNAHLADPDTVARPKSSVEDPENGFKLPNTEPGRLKRLASLFTDSNDIRVLTRNADAVWNAVYGHPENAEPRQLYTYDPTAFNGDGRIAVAVGNLDTATAVAVHTPGITTTIRSIGLNVDNAENHHIRARREQGDVETAVVSWIGYDAPSGNPIKLGRETATQQFAEAGGHRLAHDVAGIVGSRSDSPNIHLFGHSYGSTTTAHAGVGGRLGDYVSTVTLLGSPGAGPLAHAREFGIGAENVYVASASRDVVTWTGSHMDGTPNRASTYLQNLSTSTFVGVVEGRYGPLTNLAMGISNLAGGLSGRLSGLGQGFDPAMSEFGANRLAAQYNSPEHLGGIKPHTRYFASEEFAGRDPVLLRDDPNVRVTESLDNFSHILTGNTDQLSLETNHRDPDAMFGDPARTRAADPALGYPTNDCVPRTIYGFSERHPDTTVKPVDGEYGDRGVPRSDYERALGTQLRDATLNDILAAIRRGESVIVVDTYHANGLPDGHPGSHTYAVEPNLDDPSRPLVYEGDERTPRPWPPQGLDHVSHTQIATFHPDGTPTHPNTDTTHTPRSGDDQRIAAAHRDSPEHRDPTELPAQDRTEGHDYPPDHISDLLDLPAYHPGSLSDYEVRSVYLNGEQRMHALHENLVQRGVDPETRARAMFEARNELRSWARELMSDRAGAERLTRENPNQSWDDIVAKYRERGLDGDDLYNTIADRSMASRPSVNESLGLDPNRPPPLPEVRGGPDDRIGAAHPDSDPTHTGETRAQSDESGYEPHRPLQNTDLPSQLPTDPALRDQVIAEAVHRAQEQHQARADEVKRLRAEAKDLTKQVKEAQGDRKQELKQELAAKRTELNDAQLRADESRELIRAVSQVDHLQGLLQQERHTPATDGTALRAAQQRIDEARPVADTRQVEVRRLARELAAAEAARRSADQAHETARADELAARTERLESQLQRARRLLRTSDRRLRTEGNREQHAAWRHSSNDSREMRLSQQIDETQRRLAARYSEFVACDDAYADVRRARSNGEDVGAALDRLQGLREASELARRVDLDAEIRSVIDEVTRQYLESRIRTDGIDDAWVSRELMSNEDRAAHWPVVDLHHIRQDIANRVGEGAEWQFERQMRGLTRCTAEEVADALSIFHDSEVRPARGGNAPARTAFQAALRHQLRAEADRLVTEGRFADADQFLTEQVAYVVSQLAALHEQDCAGGGADHIPTYVGLPVLADGSINSSLGSLWTQTIAGSNGDLQVYQAIRAIAQAQIAAGRGADPLDIWYTNFS